MLGRQHVSRLKGDMVGEGGLMPTKIGGSGDVFGEEVEDGRGVVDRKIGVYEFITGGELSWVSEESC